MLTESLYADFNNADRSGRLRLNCAGTARDLDQFGIRLSDGLRVRVHDDELEADAEVQFSPDERIWVAVIDWDAVRQIAR